MGPADYQHKSTQSIPGMDNSGYAAIAPQAGGVAAGATLEGALGAAVGGKHQGTLQTFYEHLGQFHARICDQRDILISLNERLGSRHIPQQGNPAPSVSPPQEEGLLPAIQSHLDLIHEALNQTAYQIERLKQL